MQGAISPACLCCGALVEDDEHVLAGCPATGSADWEASFSEVWARAAARTKLEIALPPPDWVAAHRLPLVAALIPEGALWHVRLPVADASRFLRRLHLLLAEQLAEWMRRRGELGSAVEAGKAGAPEATRATVWRRGQRRACAVPAERRLQVVELRQAEVARDEASSSSSVAAGSRGPVVPSGGPARAAWLRERLVVLLTT